MLWDWLTLTLVPCLQKVAQTRFHRPRASLHSAWALVAPALPGTQQWPLEAPSLCAPPWTWQLWGQGQLLPALSMGSGHGDRDHLVGSVEAAAPFQSSTGLAGHRGWTGRSSIVAPGCELAPAGERREAGRDLSRAPSTCPGSQFGG